MGKEICVDCKKESYNCHDWCLLYIKAKIKNKEETYDEARTYTIEKCVKLKRKRDKGERRR